MPREGSRGVAAAMLAVLATGMLPTGCAGTSALRGSPPPKQAPLGRTYLQQLSTEQAKLARAEAAIPRRARTPAALSRSIKLLAAAIAGLGTGLQAIHPPSEVAVLHQRLLGVVRIYHRRLAVAARQARTRAGELRAAEALAAATSSASAAFTATVASINRRLAH